VARLAGLGDTQGGSLTGSNGLPESDEFQALGARGRSFREGQDRPYKHPAIFVVFEVAFTEWDELAPFNGEPAAYFDLCSTWSETDCSFQTRLPASPEGLTSIRLVIHSARNPASMGHDICLSRVVFVPSAGADLAPPHWPSA